MQQNVSKNGSMEDLQKTSLLDAGSSYLEHLYESFLTNPQSVAEDWRQFFEATLAGQSPATEVFHSVIQDQFLKLARHPRNSIYFTQGSKPNADEIAQPRAAQQSAPLQLAAQSAPQPVPQVASQAASQPVLINAQVLNAELSLYSSEVQQALEHERKQTRVHALIDAYRLLGHLHADIDPLKNRVKIPVPELMLSFYRLGESDLESIFEAGSLPGPKIRTLQQILLDLNTIYCGTIASEFMHIPDSPERTWVQHRVETLLLEKRQKLSVEVKRRIFERLSAAEGLEKYLGAKYPGAKRFSFEGCDSLIVALDELIENGGTVGAKEIVMGMAHRGRLNVLTNLMGKLPGQLFDEFEGKHDQKLESGDVKYHQGFSSNIETAGGTVHVTLAFNPSHLEIVSPVVCGSVRARQERRHDTFRTEVLAVLMHGDAAFAGQGVVMETLNMSNTRGYKIGGSINIIINNQIGFTTSNPQDARSTLYCSDIGKMMEIPIFHVNADDPEAVYCIVQLALEYRNKFKKDVIIDLVGYRRQGHNEADEPAVTQPLMYQFIRKHPTVGALYAEKLISEGIISKEESEKMSNDYRDALEARQNQVAKKLVLNNGKEVPHEYSQNWQQYFTKDWRMPIKTSVPLEELQMLGKRLETLPGDFVLHPRVQKIMDDRRKMLQGEIPIDWGYGETLAYATLLEEGFAVRMTGQDCGRGTFFHRHAVLHNQKNDAEYLPLQHISTDQAPFYIYDSLLSEQAVLGFEYGYSATSPNHLVIWEAQFGDFANNAQVVIDQFISSGEHKWGRLSGLTLFLPHGYEGQGPEHSSARLERYLQMCAEHNMQVCVPTTPAQVFHMLRRQMLRNMRKPLIVITPKSLLRHKLAVSTLQDLSEGTFLSVIPEVESLPANTVKRIILCSGKIYYDLLEARRVAGKQDIAIIRIEQLYPFPDSELNQALTQYPNARDVVWCQEEPQNQGAWYSTNHNIISALLIGQTLRYVGREASAAPAAGYIHLHEAQQKKVVEEALR